jgi:response regulator of citrate/malate metabolism
MYRLGARRDAHSAGCTVSGARRDAYSAGCTVTGRGVTHTQHGAQIRTLIVDDDFMVARVHRAFTERVPGFEVVGVAHSGGEALQAVERLDPDLVVLDIYLPDMSGLAVLQELRRRQLAVDVVMVTAARDVDSLRSAMAGGALRYIVKPFNFDRFSETLQTYQRFLGKRAALDEVDQEDVDRLYATFGAVPEHRLPKNLNRPTLELVLRYLREHPDPVSAQEVGHGTGISRGTARRYLEFLDSQGRAVLELRYGSAGRPEHRYRLAELSGATAESPPGAPAARSGGQGRLADAD